MTFKMEWERHINILKSGKEVSFRPKGNSMLPKIKSGQLITVSPDVACVKQDDIVFCRVKGHYYVHLVKAVDGDRFLIGNNKGKINGWTSRTKIFGRVIKIED